MKATVVMAMIGITPDAKLRALLRRPRCPLVGSDRRCASRRAGTAQCHTARGAQSLAAIVVDWFIRCAGDAECAFVSADCCSWLCATDGGLERLVFVLWSC